MAGALFIRLNNGQSSWRVDEPGGASGEDDLDQAATHARGRAVIVLVPVADAPLFEIQLPTRNRARMALAVPYALEEQLSQDVDELHFALGKPDAEGRVSVAVVARDKMDDWLARLAALGLQPRHIVIDALALPLQPGTWSGLLEPGQLLLRQGPQQGIAMDSANLSWMLPLLLEQAGEPLPDLLRTLDCDPQQPSLPPLELPVEHEPCGGTPLHHLCSGFDRAQSIDLLQGSYSPSEQSHRLWRTWRVAATLALAWVLVSMIQVGMENHRLGARELALREDITTSFRNTFPDEKAILDPRIQMQQKLDSLRQGGSNSGGGFLELLSQSGSALSADRSIKLSTVRYKQNRLDLELELPTLQALDKLKSVIQGQGLQVTIRNARSREGKVEGRLEIKAGKG